jgi:eukaryotic-like serine/threonine-protein kinase
MSNLDETIGGFESSDRHPLEMLADEFSTALRKGSNPSIAEFADRVPQMREQAFALLQSIMMFEQVSQQEDSRHRLDRSTNRFKSRSLEVLGDFKIIREIGRGGMGIIYEAEQLSLKRRVALKVLGPSVADSARQLDRFRRESEAIARLHHTNIVPVFGVGTEEGVHYFAMQLIEGKPLSTPPDLSFQEIARIGMQAASALAYAHEHGVLHRDVKPSNLILDVNGELWVTDFGLAKLTDSSELTQDGDIMGTLKYMAPEQLDGRSDARTDVYSLGLTLYELTTHQPAFDTSKSLAERIRNYDIVKPRTINPAIPRSLETIILKATARDAHARYQSALEMGEDLRCFIDDRPIAARRASAAERLGRWVRRNPALAGSLALTLLVLIATSIVSGLGYWTTQQALGEAERAGKAAVLARDAADKSRAQAEANLNVATTAFDAIFDNVAKRGVPQALALNVSPLEDDLDATASSVQLDAPHFESRLTTADTELLASLLSFYREFAKQNTEDRELQSRIARAYRRSGQIQQRLGEIDEAIASYDVALSMLVELVQSNPEDKSGPLAIAQILNDRGVAAFTNTEFFPDIVEHHHRAATLLKSQPDAVTSMPEVRFEIARSLDLAGSLIARRGVTNADLADVDRTEAENSNMRGRGMPRGFVPPFFDNKRRQMELRDREHPLPPAIDKLFANIAPPNASRDGEFAFRPAPPRDPPPGYLPDGRFDERGRNRGPERMPERMPGRGGPGGPPNFSDIAKIVEAELNEASQLLGSLCDEFPENEEYQLASAQVNRHRMQLFLFAGRGDASQAAFELARASMLKLVELHPNYPQYMFELADTLSYASSRMQSITTAEEKDYLEQAIHIGERLCEAFPAVPEYSTLLASSRDKFGRFSRQHQRWQDAESNFLSSAEGMETLHKQFPDNGYYRLSSVLTLNNLAMLYLDDKSGLASRDKYSVCRDRLQAAIKSLGNGEKPVDPLSDRLTQRARETLRQLNQRLNN